MDNLLILSMIGLFAISIFFGLLIGAMRGRKKAFLRLLTLVAAFLLSLAFTPAIAKTSGKMLLESYSENILSGSEGYIDLILSNYDSLSGMALMLINPLVFIPVFIGFWLISLIIYWILAATIGKRKKNENGDKKPRKALTGMLIGILCGFVMFLPIFIPLNGYLSTAKELNKIKIDGEPILVELEKTSFSGYTVDIEEYNDHGFIKAMGLFGVSNMCFDSLASAKINNEKIVLRDETGTFVKVYEQYEKLNKKDLLGDVDALQAVTDELFNSKIVTVAIDYIIDYYLENPDELDKLLKNSGSEGSGSEKSTEGMDSLISDNEYITTVLKELKGNMKAQVNAVLGVLRTINELDISLSSFKMETVSELEEADVSKLVESIFDVVIVREMLPYLTIELINPLADMVGVETKFIRPKLTAAEWDAEKTHAMKIFRSMSSLTGLMKISDSKETDNLDEMEEYFTNKANAETLGELMDGLRKSKLVNQLYHSLTAFDAEKQEYFFISYFNDLIFMVGDEDPDLQTINSLEADRTLRPLFEQKGALKTNGVSANDNIDFELFDWGKLFEGVADIFSLMQNIKSIEGKDFSNASKEDFISMMSSMQDMDNNMLQSVLETLVPENSDILIPNLTDVNMENETDIIKSLFDYQEISAQKQEGENMDRSAVEGIVETMAGSEFVLNVLSSANTTIKTTEQEKIWIMEELDSSDYGQEKQAALKKMFGINAG